MHSYSFDTVQRTRKAIIQLTEDLSQRLTIEQLSRKALVNSHTLENPATLAPIHHLKLALNQRGERGSSSVVFPITLVTDSAGIYHKKWLVGSSG